MTTTQIIERVRKLLALASSANGPEGETAARQARLMMARHRIEMHQVPSHPDAVPSSTGAPIHSYAHEDDPLRTATNFERLGRWRFALAEAIARAYGCRAIVFEDEDVGQHDMCLVGTDEDVRAVHILYDILVPAVDRLARSARRAVLATIARPPKPSRAKKTRRKKPEPVDGHVWMNSFRQGAVDRLAERLEEAREDAEQALRDEAARAGPGALVPLERSLSRLEAIDDATERVFEAFQCEFAPAGDQRIDNGAYMRGHDAAARLPVRAPAGFVDR